MTDPTNPYWGQAPGPGFGTGTGTDVNRLHDYDDVDIGSLSHHHTLGTLSGQAAAGSHTHNGLDSSKIGLLARSNSTSVLAGAATGTELKDTGLGDIVWQPVNKGIYYIKYKGRPQANTANETGDMRIRYAVYPASPTNLSPMIEAVSVALAGVGGPFAISMICDGFVVIPDDIAPGKYNIGAFYAGTAGAGTFFVASTAGSRRQLSVQQIGWK